MTDSLFLNLWFPRFLTEEMLPRAVAVMQQFPFSVTKPGITYLTLNPVSWNEPTILERRFDPGVPPEEAAAVAAELLHDDYAYVFEACWDLWTLSETNATWKLEPVQVKFIVHGREFEEGIFEQDGHIQTKSPDEQGLFDFSELAEGDVRIELLTRDRRVIATFKL